MSRIQDPGSSLFRKSYALVDLALEIPDLADLELLVDPWTDPRSQTPEIRTRDLQSPADPESRPWLQYFLPVLRFMP